MKNNLCAHCKNAVQVEYSGFFCDKTGYIENKSLTEWCDNFKPDEFSDMAKIRKEIAKKGVKLNGSHD